LTAYAGGGAGGSYDTAISYGSFGGGNGGLGSPTVIAPTNGGANTGGGGGGGGNDGQAGGNGGSGIIVIRYPSNFPTAIATGTFTYSLVNNDRVYKFTADGSITF
jgi:hypothetical protein